MKATGGIPVDRLLQQFGEKFRGFLMDRLRSDGHRGARCVQGLCLRCHLGGAGCGAARQNHRQRKHDSDPTFQHHALTGSDDFLGGYAGGSGIPQLRGR